MCDLRRNDPPLAPHEEQEGWLYIRVKRSEDGWGSTRPNGATGLSVRSPHGLKFAQPPTRYVDSHDESRIIASERVERAVENDDIFRLCAERNLRIGYSPAYGEPWEILSADVDAWGHTLREAYENYLAGVAACAVAARRNFR